MLLFRSFSLIATIVIRCLTLVKSRKMFTFYKFSSIPESENPLTCRTSMIHKLLFCLLCLTLLGGRAEADTLTRLQTIKLGAEQGNAEAQNKLGAYFELGLGVTQDDGEAVKWYRLAADQGYAEAQFNLGEMYEAGKGVAKNMPLAIAWYEKACKNGWKCACRSLGLLTDNEGCH